MTLNVQIIHGVFGIRKQVNVTRAMTFKIKVHAMILTNVSGKERNALKVTFHENVHFTCVYVIIIHKKMSRINVRACAHTVMMVFYAIDRGMSLKISCPVFI